MPEDPGFFAHCGVPNEPVMRPPGNVTSNVPTADGWNDVNVIVPDVALFAGDASVSPQAVSVKRVVQWHS